MLDEIAKFAQKCFSLNPVIVLGSGVSMHHGMPGMGELQAHLIAKIQAEEAEEDAWTLVRTALAEGDHLEQALGDKSLPASLVAKIVEETWNCINEHDHQVFVSAIDGTESFPVGELFEKLFNSSNNFLNVVTTNYDRIAEYASGSVALLHSVGFTPGYLQFREGTDRISVYRGSRPARTVRIWKVHGSLDWFERKDGTTLSVPLFELPSNGLKPLIVTPGVSKYQRTHDEPFRSAIQGADQCLENAEAYLCVGFGFRDSHIEPKLVERCKRNNIPITVLARTLTEEARAFLKSKAGTHYLAFEEYKGGTKAYTAEQPDGIDFPGVDFWSLGGYLKRVT